jgi:hypothetical protein
MTRDELAARKTLVAFHRAARVAKAIEIVKTGKCPDCGAGLRQNLSLQGWWQCDQYGSEGFRKDDSKPSCSFQTFTV